MINKKTVFYLVFVLSFHIKQTVRIRIKIRDYRQIYEDRSDPIVFLSVSVNSSGLVYEDFTRLFFLYTDRRVRTLTGELPRNLSIFVSGDLHAWSILKNL
jgi:hypothetical protein